jgi:hypothetical protein
VTTHTARIRLPRPGSGSNLIEIDGVAVQGATRAMRLDSAAGSSLTTLTLDLLVHDIEIDGEVAVVLPEKTVAALRALGWTPPEGGA